MVFLRHSSPNFRVTVYTHQTQRYVFSYKEAKANRWARMEIIENENLDCEPRALVTEPPRLSPPQLSSNQEQIERERGKTDGEKEAAAVSQPPEMNKNPNIVRYQAAKVNPSRLDTRTRLGACEHFATLAPFAHFEAKIKATVLSMREALRKHRPLLRLVPLRVIRKE
ncbi:hypothetical protein D9756_006764 [Leucocoprinus leucothites]|uniref:Uncharacterized protein n=1 Tax=Leucocoprinus leucothites TaxID=201217 RepID=A0A8H5LGK6_9AGAR|nr:hypothetical protein D9756_006764 [Leucoagaricus leucothites]